MIVHATLRVTLVVWSMKIIIEMIMQKKLRRLPKILFVLLVVMVLFMEDMVKCLAAIVTKKPMKNMYRHNFYTRKTINCLHMVWMITVGQRNMFQLLVGTENSGTQHTINTDVWQYVLILVHPLGKLALVKKGMNFQTHVSFSMMAVHMHIVLLFVFPKKIKLKNYHTKMLTH